ncbi:MAG: hypothetical protein EA397_16935 [Deltaproteobacteria bacterium]|nr:MAG: hypothetical protein EA397_16935 [Deltaproteobacteria bacterium]
MKTAKRLVAVFLGLLAAPVSAASDDPTVLERENAALKHALQLLEAEAQEIQQTLQPLQDERDRLLPAIEGRREAAEQGWEPEETPWETLELGVLPPSLVEGDAQAEGAPSPKAALFRFLAESPSGWSKVEDGGKPAEVPHWIYSRIYYESTGAQGYLELRSKAHGYAQGKIYRMAMTERDGSWYVHKVEQRTLCHQGLTEEGTCR